MPRPPRLALRADSGAAGAGVGIVDGAPEGAEGAGVAALNDLAAVVLLASSNRKLRLPIVNTCFAQNLMK